MMVYTFSPRDFSISNYKKPQDLSILRLLVCSLNRLLLGVQQVLVGLADSAG